MALTSNLNLLGTRLANEFRAIRVLISGSEIGDTSGLNTTSKNLVGAINELKASVDALVQAQNNP